jgi:hypothetical protein
MSSRVCASKKVIEPWHAKQAFHAARSNGSLVCRFGIVATHFHVSIMVYTKTQFLVLSVEPSPC